VYPIKILLDTNIPNVAPFALTRGLFYDPKKERHREGESEEDGKEYEGEKDGESEEDDDEEDDDEEDEKKNGEKKDKSEEYPLFTFDVLYPTERIEDLGIDFFFDKTLFMKTLKGLSRTKIDSEKHENGKQNVYTMIKVLFPTNFPTEGNIHTSFEENIQKNPIVSDESIPLIPKWILKYFTKEETKFSYVKVESSPYTIYRITWVNDFINHPEYKKLININITNQKLKSRQIPKLKRELEKKVEDLHKIWEDFIDKLEKENEYDQNKSSILKKIESNLNEYKKRSSIMINIIPRLLASIQKLLQYNDDIEAVKPVAEDLYKINIYLKKANDAINIDITPFQFESIGFKEFMKRGIQVYYMNKIIENIANKDQKKTLLEKQEEADDEDFQHELSKYNYSDFKSELKSYIAPIRKSSNPDLQNMISKDANSKFKGESVIDFSKFLNYIHESYLSKHNKPQNAQLTNLLDIGVNIMNSENDDELIEDYDEKEKNTEEEDSQTTLEIYLQIDLIKGVLTDEIISRIECGLRGIFLVKMYKELKLKETDSFKLSKHRPLIDINNMEEEIKRTKEEALNDDSHKTADGESSKGKTLSTNTSVEEHDDSEYNDEDDDDDEQTASVDNSKTGGKRRISKRKILSKNMRKTKRRMK
jgi:hypothetical protein